MSGVSGGDDPDLTTIMNGGGNFVARITAFYKAKQDADEAVKKYGQIANITAKQADVDAAHAKIADELKAANEQAERKVGDAGAVASQMTADAGHIVEEAKATAEKIIADANARADTIRSDAQVLQTKAQVASSAIEARSNELARVQLQLDDKRRELDASIAASKQSKDKYDAKYATLSAALAAQG